MNKGESLSLEKEHVQNLADMEISEIENGDYSDEERVEMMAKIISEFHSPESGVMKEAAKSGDIAVCRLNQDSDAEAFYLTDFVEDNTDGKKQSLFGDHYRYYQTKDRLIVPVEQCKLWIVPRAKRPYFEMKATECSALIGYGEDKVAMAHVGFSGNVQTDQAMRLMRDSGITDFWVVASVGKHQEEMTRRGSFLRDRVATVDAYKKIGIPEHRIVTFEHSQDLNGSGRFGAVQVVVSSDHIYKYCFDIDSDSSNKQKNKRGHELLSV